MEYILSDDMENRRTWRLDRSFNLSHLLYALVILGGCLAWFGRIESGMAVHTSQINDIQKSTSEMKGDINNRLDRIEKGQQDITNLLMNRNK